MATRPILMTNCRSRPKLRTPVAVPTNAGVSRAQAWLPPDQAQTNCIWFPATPRRRRTTWLFQPRARLLPDQFWNDLDCPSSRKCNSAQLKRPRRYPTQQPHRKPTLTITVESAAAPCGFGNNPTWRRNRGRSFRQFGWQPIQQSSLTESQH